MSAKDAEWTRRAVDWLLIVTMWVGGIGFVITRDEAWVAIAIGGAVSLFVFEGTIQAMLWRR